MIYNQEDIWDDDITNYYEIEPVLLNRYFLFEDLTHQKSINRLIREFKTCK
jgi:hypothetical protein